MVPALTSSTMNVAIPRPLRRPGAETINADLACRAVRFLAGDSMSSPHDEALFARDFRAIGPASQAFSVPTVKGHATQCKPFTDVRLDIRDVNVAENSAAVRLTFAGRHASAYQGCPGTGRQMEADGVVLLRFDHGCVVEASSLLQWRPAAAA